MVVVVVAVMVMVGGKIVSYGLGSREDAHWPCKVVHRAWHVARVSDNIILCPQWIN